MFEKIGEIISIVLLAVALGLDGFSVCLGLGLQNLRLKRIAIIGITIGFFHFVLPFAGMIIGKVISTKITIFAMLISGSLLFFLGIYMIFSTFSHRKQPPINPYGIKLISLAFIVSLDSFPVGISLGLIGLKTIFLVVFFGLITMILSWLGLLIGKKASTLLGTYSERIGGLILSMFGLFYLFG